MDLRIDYEQTRNIGNQLISKSDAFNSLLRNIESINSQISQSWAGADAQKYLGAVEEQAKYMQLLSSTIAEIGNYLIGVSAAYQEASESNASAINY